MAWLVLKAAVGLRLTEVGEALGVDEVETGMRAYPEFAMYEKGLIYRGQYMINWCPRCHTALSDLEVVYDQTEGNLWHNGGTGGFHSFMIIDAKREAAVIILSNTSTNIVDAFGKAVFDIARGEKNDFEWP